MERCLTTKRRLDRERTREAGTAKAPTSFVKCFHQEAVLIPNLEDSVAYTSFLSGLKNGQFKFSLAEPKETTLAEA